MNEAQFYEATAKQYLADFGNKTPNVTQLQAMKELLAHSWLKRAVVLDTRLTPREQQCLYYFSQGKTSEAVARLLRVKKRTIQTYREGILSKLSCQNMMQAVGQGIRYGALQRLN